MPKPRGRKVQSILPMFKKQRALLTVKYHRLRHQKQDMINMGQFDGLAELEPKIREVISGMEQSGGIPKSWRI